ncbi:MAG: LVIVD repeat-containing protein, partial [Candidatus Thorarchaeota archaeon]
ISDPTNPGLPVYENTTGYAIDVHVSGDYAYVADHNGLAVIDISDPTNPGTPVYEDTTGLANDVYVSGNYAYITCWTSGLAIIDISDPKHPGTPVYEDTIEEAYGVYVSGDYAYVADYGSGLAVIDISDPTNPGTPIYEDTTGLANDVYVSGSRAYVADDNSGLAIIDISNPIPPRAPVYKDTIGDARDIYVSGDYAYVADHSEGLAVINISNPTDPGTPVYEDTADYARGIYVSGDYVYIADSDSGLAIINISDPTDPGSPIYEDTTGSTWDVYVNGDYAYVADHTSGLAIIDISDPTNPGMPVYEDTANSARGVYVSGDYAYVADWGSGLAIIDISDPTNPGTPVYRNTPGSAYDVYVSGDYAYVADWGSGLTIIDISDPINPGTPVSEDTTGEAYDVYVSGDYAYVADYGSGLAVIDISDPTNPGTPVYEDTTGEAHGVYVSGFYAYVADYDSGLAVIQVREIIDWWNPVITESPSDLTVEFGYTGQNLSWTVTDASSDTYTIELQGSGIVEGPTNWTSGVTIIYNIPDGFVLGVYVYTVNFTDRRSNFITDSVNFTVGEDATNPNIISAPSDFILEFGYTGQSLSWTATDASPDTYTIELQGSGIVEGPTTWTSGVIITYNIPDGLALDVYIYTVNFTDDYDNSIIDSVIVKVEDTTKPIITINSPILNDEFATSAPAYNISINEPHLDQIWYTLDGGTTNISITFLSGSINQTAWDGISLGSVTLVFYANDTLGNIGFMSVGISKVASIDGEPSEPPDLLGIIATFLSIIGGTFTFLGIMYRTIYTGRIKPKKWARKLKSSRDEKIRFQAASKLKKSKRSTSSIISALEKVAYDPSENPEIRNLAKEALKERGMLVND